MKPASFEFIRAASVAEAIAALDHDDAKIIAGGQSLVPMMNFRLARPTVLVDLERIPGLDRIEPGADMLEIGAMARQAQVARSTAVTARLPILAAALTHVGHHQIRTRGTFGGSMAHADPAAELPALAVLLDAKIHVSGPSGTRSIDATTFFQAPFTTDLHAGEILTSVGLPIGAVETWAFEELARRSGDFAIAGVAATSTAGHVRLVAFGLGWVPVRLHAAEAELGGKDLDDKTISQAAAAARAEVDPMSDIHADSEYRRHAVATLVERALHSMRP
jgi:carbon-monoxide dehydrogenase medium subunit